MNKYDNFFKFYNKYSKELLFGENSLRPAKSITRNIITGVEPFVDFYKNTKKLSFSAEDVSCKILNLNTKEVTSTTRDNIRNMEELKFLLFDNNKCKLTRNFIEFVNSGITLKEYILDQMAQISTISEMSMFYNCLLCVLREYLINNEVIVYPDSYNKFSAKVKSIKDRKELCESIYKIYGFHGSKNVPFGYYTPNANYRIVSTCVALNLITKTDNKNKFGFTKYIISTAGIKLLDRLEENFSKLNPIEKEEKEEAVDSNMYEDMYDAIYIAQTNAVPMELLEDYVQIDIPQALPNSLQIGPTKRDPKKAAFAKKSANYSCENDFSHKSFTGANGNQFCEAHHLIPMAYQHKFMFSLDVEANIVSLCPNCHSILHHAFGDEKVEIIKKLYNKRIERLKKCNIFVTLDQLLEFYK